MARSNRKKRHIWKEYLNYWQSVALVWLFKQQNSFYLSALDERLEQERFKRKSSKYLEFPCIRLQTGHQNDACLMMSGETNTLIDGLER